VVQCLRRVVDEGDGVPGRLLADASELEACGPEGRPNRPAGCARAPAPADPVVGPAHGRVPTRGTEAARSRPLASTEQRSSTLSRAALCR
jgi:hypothetical protein